MCVFESVFSCVFGKRTSEAVAGRLSELSFVFVMVTWRQVPCGGAPYGRIATGVEPQFAQLTARCPYVLEPNASGVCCEVGCVREGSVTFLIASTVSINAFIRLYRLWHPPATTCHMCDAFLMYVYAGAIVCVGRCGARARQFVMSDGWVAACPDVSCASLWRDSRKREKTWRQLLACSACL